MSTDAALPPRRSDGLRHWRVAGGVLIDERGVLLVQNRRRGGEMDWSTPGGVVDAGETPLGALSREVAEETGLRVSGWSKALYRVEVVAPDAGFFLEVDAHRATGFAGEISIDDPDGIVVAAAFFPLDEAAAQLDGAPPWVAEPLLAHLDGGLDDGKLFAYTVSGSRSERIVHRRS